MNTHCTQSILESSTRWNTPQFILSSWYYLIPKQDKDGTKKKIIAIFIPDKYRDKILKNTLVNRFNDV